MSRTKDILIEERIIRTVLKRIVVDESTDLSTIDKIKDACEDHCENQDKYDVWEEETIATYEDEDEHLDFNYDNVVVLLREETRLDFTYNTAIKKH